MKGKGRQKPKRWGPPQGRRLASIREEKGFSLQEFAEAIKVTPEAARNWERGTNEPTRNIYAICKLLDVARNKLYEIFPPFDRLGVTLVRAFPFSERRIEVLEPLYERMEEDQYEYCPADECQTVEEIWYSFETFVGSRFDDEFSRDSALVKWAKSGTKALIIYGFRGSESIESGIKNWAGLFEIIRKARNYCRIILVQAVDPFHSPVFNTASSRGIKSIPHLIDADDEALGSISTQLLEELPTCCLKAIGQVISSPEDVPERSCVDKLVEAGILSWRDSALELRHPSWREPWARKLLV